MRAKIRSLILFFVILSVLGGNFAAPHRVYAAGFVVNTTADNTAAGDGFCTLREAIQSANNAGNGDCGPDSPAADTITFDASLSGATIMLGSTLPNIVSGQGALTMDGSSLAAPITISGNNAVRVMRVESGASLTLNSITVANGNAGIGDGGGIVNGGTLTITNSTLSGNSAGVGGGIFNDSGGTLTITASTLSGNSAGSSGGGIFNDSGGTLTITASTLSGNSAGNRGGGIFNSGGSTLTITNSTLSGNSAGNRGGGIFNSSGSTLTITNSTLSGNSANNNGGGILNGSGGTLTLTNTIIANSPSGGDCVTLTPVSSAQNNLIEDFGGACGLTHGVNGNIVGSDPALGALTGSPGYFPLNPGSPAIDAGNNASCPAADQRGETRPADGNADGTAVCDIGSFELQIGTPPLVTNVSAPGVGTIFNAAQIAAPLTQFTVRFDQDVSPASATDPDNYLLLRGGANGIQTQSCAGGVSAADTRISVDSVTYANNGGAGPFEAALSVNGGTPLPSGAYRLLVCGTTSIGSRENGLDLNAGWIDYHVVFLVASQTSDGSDPGTGTAAGAAPQLPATGFAPNKVTSLPPQPLERAYAETSLALEIPALNVKANIVGVPQAEGSWEVAWLWRDVGWLNGTAFPTWEGNSALTAHAYDANGQPGPFANLKALQYGDRVIVHLSGQKYIFEVRQTKLVRPDVTDFALQHLKGYAYLTLITCQTYNPLNDSYLFRRVVRAVLVSVE